MKNISVNLRRILREEAKVSDKGVNKETILKLLRNVLEGVEGIAEDDPDFFDKIKEISNLDHENDKEGFPVSFSIVLMDKDVIKGLKEKLESLNTDSPSDADKTPGEDESPSPSSETAAPSETQTAMSEEEKEMTAEIERIKKITNPEEKEKARKDLEEKMAAGNEVAGPGKKDLDEDESRRERQNRLKSELDKFDPVENEKVNQVLKRNKGKNRELSDEEISGDDPKAARRARARDAQGKQPEKEDRRLSDTVGKIGTSPGGQPDWRQSIPRINNESKKLNNLKKLIREIARNETGNTKR